jgi:serine phosphatase RsbU (regulator of sigma subunit)
VLAGLAWLVLVTDLGLIWSQWPALFLLCLFLFLFRRLSFFFFIESPGRTHSQFESNFEPMVVWSAALILGPTSLWIAVFLDTLAYARRMWRASGSFERWDLFRNLLHNLVTLTLASLIALSLYGRWGGSIPLSGLTPAAVLPAILATFVHVGVQVLAYAPLVLYVAAGGSPVFRRESGWLGVLTWGLVITLGATGAIEIFAILAAGLYTQTSPAVYYVFLAGLLLVSWLAHRLSMYLERSQQRSRELERLEELGRAILRAPADALELPDLLEEHVSGMFMRSWIEIFLLPDRTLLHSPDDWPPVDAAAWEWLWTSPQARFFLPGSSLPWDAQLGHNVGLAVVPILETEGAGEARSLPLGGIYVLREHDPYDVASYLPALQSLAAQIASALHRAEVFRIEQELAVAGRIQASFLPDSLPQIPGWQLAARLVPARETSGDFYDVIPLAAGRWGLLVADVAGKGTGAALYMALSRTLIRTYAVEYDQQPELALRAANRRILADARADLFVTVFYGVLDPDSGTLTYCNAGHNPPYLLGPDGGDWLQTLTRTGLPLGVLEDETWQPRTVQIHPGVALVLYTDGVTEAQNARGEFLTREGLLEALAACCGESAQGILEAVFKAVYEFGGEVPHAGHDDTTLMVLARGRP